MYNAILGSNIPFQQTPISFVLRIPVQPLRIVEVTNSWILGASRIKNLELQKKLN